MWYIVRPYCKSGSSVQHCRCAGTSITHVLPAKVIDACVAAVVQAVPELVSSLSRGRLSTTEEDSSEAADGSGTPGISAAAEGSPWEAKSPGDSPRSRTPLRLDSMSSDRRQARAIHVFIHHQAVKDSGWLSWHCAPSWIA